MIGLVAAGLGGLLPLLGCGGGEAGVASVVGSTDSRAGSGSAGSGAAGNCSVIPTKTAGPYSGDGSNRANGAVANVLTLGDIVRSDGFGASVANLAAVSLTGDNVPGGDGGVSQLATVTGSLSKGYSATLTFGIAA